jgi:predicted site-specific integrase-resolvase
VHGINGIATLLGVSKTMVHYYRKKGWIEPAIKQTGRKIICDAPLALELFGKNEPKTKNSKIGENESKTKDLKK